MEFEDFDDFNIKEASIKFDGEEAATEYGCVGTLSTDKETEEVSKNCGLQRIKSKTVVKWLTVTIAAHIKRKVKDNISGLTTDGLETGVSGLHKDTKLKNGVFAAVIEDFDGNRKLIAFPVVENATGLKMDIDNAATEVGMSEVEFKALADVNGFFYYQAFENELESEDIKTKWMTNFTPDLVKKKVMIRATQPKQVMKAPKVEKSED